MQKVLAPNPLALIIPSSVQDDAPPDLAFGVGDQLSSGQDYPRET